MNHNTTYVTTTNRKSRVKVPRITLTISTLWDLLQAGWNGIAAAVTGFTFSWYIGLTIWFGVLFIAKACLLHAANRMCKGKKHADFKKIAIIYLFINVVQILAITISPTFAESVFIPKIKQFTIVSLVVNTVNSIIFITSWLRVKRDKFSLDEYTFLKSKQYIGRSEGFFTILVVVLNVLVILNTYGVTTISRSTLSFIYLGIGLGSSIYSLILGIWLVKTEKFN